MSGYEKLIELGFPVPSARTLRWYIEGFSYDSGVLEGMLKILKTKVAILCHSERECCFTGDEMKITAKLEYDASSDTFEGETTYHSQKGLAEHVLVFMLSGLITKWKQTIGYYFTGEGTDGTCLKDIV